MNAKRSLGQNFLVSETAIARILQVCRFACSSAAGVVEVGPGRGALTAGLVRMGRPYWAVEKDDALAEGIRTRFPDAQVAAEDARTFDWCRLPRVTGLFPWLLVGNLPYNAGTEILRGVLSRREVFSGAVVMLQLEVARKFCAEASQEGYGPLSVWADPWWTRHISFTVPSGSFRPVPKVTSAVCAFAARTEALLPSENMGPFRDFLQRAFRQRRKTLASNLAGQDRESKEDWEGEIAGSGAPAASRPDAVPPEIYRKLFTLAESRPRPDHVP